MYTGVFYWMLRGMEPWTLKHHHGNVTIYGKLPQQVIPHTPQTTCRHYVMSQSIFEFSVRKTYCDVTLCQQEFIRVKNDLLWHESS